eukprot:7128497-Pyramimonas_sp.AAC.1
MGGGLGWAPQAVTRNWYNIRAKMREVLFKVMQELDEGAENEESLFKQNLPPSSVRRQLLAMQR